MIEINLNEEERALVKMTGHPQNIVHDYLLMQEAYYDTMGLISFDEEEPEPSNIVIDEKEKCEYISDFTGIDMEVCYDLSLADLEYLLSQGATVEDSEYHDDTVDKYGRIFERSNDS